MVEQLSMSWPSPYLKYINKLRESVCLNFCPPTQRYLKTHLYTWSLTMVNTTLKTLSLPHVPPLTRFKVQPYIFEHQHLDTMAQVRLSNAGLGNRFPRWAGFFYPRQHDCPLCPGSRLCETHVILSCSSIEAVRSDLGVSFYRNRCLEKGMGLEAIMTNFVNGIDINGNPIGRSEIVDNGLALDTLRGHWLSMW